MSGKSDWGLTNNVLTVCVRKECILIVSDDRGVIAGVERAGHGWADEGAETGVGAWRHVQPPTKPQYGVTHCHSDTPPFRHLNLTLTLT